MMDSLPNIDTFRIGGEDESFIVFVVVNILLSLDLEMSECRSNW